MACGTAKVMHRNPSPVVLRKTAVPRRCERRLVGALAALLAACGLMLTPAAQAHESEQYTLPIGRDFADLGPYFSRIFYDAIVGAVAETNAAISATLEGQPTATPLAELHSSEFIAGKVWEHIFAAIPANELLDAQLISNPCSRSSPDW